MLARDWSKPINNFNDYADKSGAGMWFSLPQNSQGSEAGVPNLFGAGDSILKRLRDDSNKNILFTLNLQLFSLLLEMRITTTCPLPLIFGEMPEKMSSQFASLIIMIEGHGSNSARFQSMPEEAFSLTGRFHSALPFNKEAESSLRIRISIAET